MRFVALMSCAGALVACGGGGDSSDEESCQKLDTGVTDGLDAYASATPDPATNPPVSLDFGSCPVRPAPGNRDCTFVGVVKDFQDDEVPAYVAGTLVKVFVDNRVDNINAACEPAGSATVAPCYEMTAPDGGIVSFANLPCNTYLAVRAYQPGWTKAALQYSQWVDVDSASRTEEIISISRVTYDMIPAVVGYAPNPKLGIVAGQLSDCRDYGVANGSVNMVAGHVDTPPAEFCGIESIFRVGTFYFVDEFPNKNQSVTAEDGLWAFANVPPGQVTVFASGRRTDGGPLEALGHIQVAAFPDTITIQDIIVQE